MRIVKISDLTDKEKEKWQQEVEARRIEREETRKQEIEKANKSFENLVNNSSNKQRTQITNLPTSVSSRRKAYNTSESTKAITNNISKSKVNLPVANEFKQQLETGKRVQLTQEYSLPTFVNKVKKNAVPVASKAVGNIAIDRAKDTLDNVAYVGKRTGTGVLQGATGIAQAGTTEVANNLEKGKQKNASELIGDTLNAFGGILNPAQGFNNTIQRLPSLISNTINTISDKNKDALEKATSLGTNAVSEAMNNNSAKRIFDSATQSVGKILPTNASDKVLEFNNQISKPVEELNQKLIEEGEKYDPITNTFGNVGQVVGNMAPAIIGTAVTKNPNVGLVAMGLSTKGQSTQEALNKGATLDEAVKIGDTKAMIEVGTEMLTGGVNIFGKGALDDIFERGIINKVKNNVAKQIAQQGINITGEVLEETISDVLGTTIDKGTVDPNASYSIEDWGDTALTTVLSTFVLNAIGGVGNIKTNRMNRETQQRLQEAQDVINNMQNEQVNTQQQQINKIAQNQTSAQLNDILNNKELPMQSYQYEQSDNVKINNLRQDANKYFNNSEKARNYVSMLEKIITDKNIDIRLDSNLKTVDGRIANGSYSNGVITINPNSTKAGEFIAIHELTHAIGTKEMLNMVNTYRRSNTEFDTAVKGLLQNYQGTEISEEALADVSAQLFGNQEFINNIAQTNPNIFQKLYSEIKYLCHQFRGYKNQNQFVEDLYYKWTQAYNSNNKLNETSNYYIETVADFNEIEYNNAKELKLPKREYAILSGIVNSDSNIKPGINYVETTNATYKVYFKETGEFKVVDKIIDGGYNDTITDRNIQGTGDTRNAESGMQIYSTNVQKQGTGTRNDEVSNINKGRTRVGDKSVRNSRKNTNNVKYSIQESENNSGSFSMDNQGRTLSKEQQEYFKDSKVRDEKGNLVTVYHGTQNGGFTQFKNYSYFTDNKDVARTYSGSIENITKNTFDSGRRTSIGNYEGYVNLTNPFEIDLEGSSWDEIDVNKINISNINELLNKNGISTYENDGKVYIGTDDIVSIVDGLNDDGANYDGIILKNIYDNGARANNNNTLSNDYIIFNKNQFKSIDNTNPTSDPDIRYSQNNQIWQQYLDKNYKPTGTRTSMQEILPTREYVESKQISSNNSNNVPYGEEIKQNIDNKVKARKHYKSIIESNYTTDEAKAIAKELMGLDTYVPDSNNKQLERADLRIETALENKGEAGIESELDSLLNRAMTGGNIKADDIAVGERLIQYYSKNGNKQKLQEAIQATAMAGTTAGQTVQAMSLLNHQTPEGHAVWLQRSIDKMNNDLRKKRGVNAEQFNLTPEMTEKILNSQNTEELQSNLDEVYKELGQQVTKSTIEKIDAWRYFAMLANFKTHGRNIIGNTAMSGMQYGIKNKIAGGIEAVVSKFNPEMERTHTLVSASKEVKQFAKEDIKNVADRLGLNDNKYNPKTRLENNMRTFKSDMMENTVGVLFELNNKALEAEDGIGLKFGYTKALAEYMTANKLTPENITDKQLAKARNYAIEQAQEATFHQASAIASALNQFSKRNKLTKFATDAILPYIKTPINVAKAGLEYNPIGLVKTITYDTRQLMKGNITVNKYIDNLSKGLTGSGIALLGYALANAGILKASGSDDKDKENYDKDRGSQSYSIQIGDNTYSLDWLAPTGIPLFIGAECYEIMQTQKETKSSSSDDDSTYNKAVKSAVNILDAFTNAMNPMTEMSMLSGLTSALKSYDDDLLAGIGVNAVKSYINQFVPTALRQIAKTTDEYERSTTSTKTGTLPKAIDSTKNYIMSGIPGLRQLLPVKTDIWGNDLKQSENIGQRALENAVLPWNRKEISTNSVDKELDSMYDKTGESSLLPDTINKNLTIDKQKYVMTSEEFAKYKKEYGQNSYKLLNSLVTSAQYKRLNDSQRQVAIEKVYEYAKEQIKIDYAKNNGLKYEESKLSKTINAINKANGNSANYLEYIALTQDMTKDKEKIEVIANSKYSDITKRLIYENNLLSKTDTEYPVVKVAVININEYLKYKQQEFSSDKKDDGTLAGKTVSKSKQKKVTEYLNSMKITGNQRLLLYAMQGYTTTSSQKTQLANYIQDLTLNKEDKLKLYDKFSGFTVYKDGRVTW